MNGEKLFHILGLIDETLIDEAECQKLNQKKKRPFIKWISGAACILLLLSGTWYIVNHTTLPGGTNGGGAGHDTGSTFMRYAGPVMPLNALGDINGISASRMLHYDFSEGEISSAHIRDDYSITNTSEEDKTITLVYPFISSLNDSGKYTPEITLNSTPLQPDLLIGNYNGVFRGVDNSDSRDSSTFNLKNIDSWEDYDTLLQNGNYFKTAQTQLSLPDQEVTVYTFQDVRYPEEYDAASLALSFILPSASMVITYGVNGMAYEDTTNSYRFSYFIKHNQGQRIIILGEPPASYTLKGYENGACEKEISEITGTIKTETKLLSEVIRECMEEYSNLYDSSSAQSSLVTEQFQYRAVISMLNYTQLGSNPKDRYYWMSLDDLISEAYSMKRIMYLTKEIIIPSDQTVEFTCQFTKASSFDYSGGTGENSGVRGYDMMTSLGSELEFTEQRAGITLPDHIQILRQNFGFDIENGNTEVPLDMNTKHYYLELKCSKTTRKSDNSCFQLIVL